MRTKYSISCMILLPVLLAGCGRVNTNTETVRQRAHAQFTNGTSRTYTRGGNYEQRTEESNGSAKLRAQKLAEGAAELDSIEKASVSISGNIAIVGISLAEELSDNELVKTKDEVDKKIKEIDPEISHVAITIDEELVQRISEISDSANIQN